jgi:drug/metabolite transporter (DMT)-like permease
VPGLGEICALLSPLAWAFAVIFFKRSADAPAVSLNLFKNVVGLCLLGLTFLATREVFPVERSAFDWARLLASGVLGLAVADTLLFQGLRRIGAARMAIADTVYAPMVLSLSWAFLGERPGMGFAFGAAAVLLGIALATIDRRALAPTGDAREQLLGSLYVVVAISCTAIGVVMAKPVLAESSLVEATLTRLVAGVAAQLAWVAVAGQSAVAFVTFRPSPLWRSLIPAAILGPYVSLLLWLGGFKWAPASVAAVLNQMATIFILVLARVLLGERLQPRQVAGALLACSGAFGVVVSR